MTLASRAAIPAAAAAAAVAPMHHRSLSRRLQSAPALGLSRGAIGQSGAAATRRRGMLGTIVVNNETILLVPDRTARRDPMNGLRPYTGGWNPADQHYWAVRAGEAGPDSVGMTASFGPIVGVAWLLLGVGIAAGICCTCCCCHERWTRMRSDDFRPYDKRDLTLPLLVMILAILALLAGLAVMLAGGIMFRSNMHAITDYAMDQVDRATAIVTNVSTAVAALSHTHVADAALPSNATTRVSRLALDVNGTAVELQGLMDKGTVLVNASVLLIYRFMFGVGMTIVLLCILGFVFALCRTVAVTNIILVFLWIMVVWAWVATGIFYATYLVEGDSVAALAQVMHNPSVNSAMSQYLPCAKQAQMQAVVTIAHSAIFTSQTFIKNELENGYPQGLQAAGATAVCVPYDPPQYNQNVSICKPGSLTLSQIFQKLNQSGSAGSVGMPEEVLSDMSALLVSTDRLESAIEGIKTIIDCAYVKNVAQFIIDQAFKLESNLQLLWIGFLIIGLACMLFCAAMPTYAFRAARLTPPGKADGLYVAQSVPEQSPYPVE
ncbi:unnamed protein product [Closterium sp. NIES-64]|nr:unnamed protein product [Closterium sp. NIES-64]